MLKYHEFLFSFPLALRHLTFLILHNDDIASTTSFADTAMSSIFEAICFADNVIFVSASKGIPEHQKEGRVDYQRIKTTDPMVKQEQRIEQAVA